MKAQTHETYIAAIVALAKRRLNAAERKLIADAKIVYGMGKPNTRGVTYYQAWTNGDGPDSPHSFVEVCAAAESSAIQLAGTTLHELGHVISFGAGHGKGWKEACGRLGLPKPLAAGQEYTLEGFDEPMREAIAALESPIDGQPVGSEAQGLSRGGPCSQGAGVRGGTSRGKGSGSRSLKVSCRFCGYVARVSKKWLLHSGAPLCPCNSEPMTEPRREP